MPHLAPPSAPVITALSDGIANALTGTAPDRRFDVVSRAELHSYPAENPRARALVCSGGGYTNLCHEKEGVEVAQWLNGIGIDAHVLVHRLPGAPDGNGGVHPKDIALTDGLTALDHLAESGGDRPLFLVGLSSGGHLAATLACQSHRSNARGVIAAYAPLNANHRDHKVPAGKPDFQPKEKQDFYDDWPIGLAGHPHALPRIPVFLAYALHDTRVPVQHALRLIETAAATDLDVDAHVFATAPHGFALRDRAGTHEAWTTQAARWIDHRL